MSSLWLVTYLITATILGVNALEGGAEKREPLAGWYGVFPELTNYQRKFQPPVINLKNRSIYSQTASYEWLGGRLETLQVTLARDPAFQTQYAPETIRKQEEAATAVQVRGKDGWLLNRNHLVVMLAEDKALIVRREGDGPDLTEVVQRFHLAAIEKALANAPRTSPERSLEHFRGLKRGSSFADLAAWVGMPDRDIGSGIHVLVYDLQDGTRVLVGTADFQQILYIRHVTRNGKSEELAK